MEAEPGVSQTACQTFTSRLTYPLFLTHEVQEAVWGKRGPPAGGGGGGGVTGRASDWTADWLPLEIEVMGGLGIWNLAPP